MIKVKRFFNKKKVNYNINLALFSSRSFSQYGEDKIISEMLGLYKLKILKYMDIGAHHPYLFNNTAILYNQGITGINIEPDPILFKKFAKIRKRDINLNIGIHHIKGVIKFYQFEKSEFNTFSKDAAIATESAGIKIVNEIDVKVETYNDIVKEKLLNIPPDILFIDAEGLDEIILKSIDYDNYSPKIICIETYAFGVGKKNYEIIDFLLKNEYSVHADTFVNTIFIKSTFAGNVLS